MLNINDLEIRQKNYKLKSYTPYLTIFISLTIISISAIFLLNYSSISTLDTNTKGLEKNEILISEETAIIEDLGTDKIKPQENIEHNVKITKDVVEQKNILNKQKKEALSEKDNTNKLSPSLNFLEKIQSTALPYYEENSNIEDDINTKKTSSNPPVNKKEPTISNVQKQVAPIIQKSKMSIEKKESLNIKRNNSNDDIHHVIKRFKVDNNPALSLFVAKKYYQLEEYENAYNYALITNGINNNIEASWIIFAKSLVKLKKKEMAIKTLKEYINHSHSGQAKLLLDEILSGKFK